jgi:F-type H+-transporting ATPase subunit a
MVESLALTKALNGVLAGPVDALLNLVHADAMLKAVGAPPIDPVNPITDAFALELLVAVGLILLFLLVRATLSVEKPAAPQQLAEMVHEFVGGNADQIIGHGYERFQAFATTIFLFVLVCNLIGLIPGIPSPTESPVVPLGIAIPTFLYYNFYGFREQGLKGYLGHFAGPIWWIAPLLFPIEIVSHFARIMSLTIRLYANMFAGGLVTLVFFSLVPLGVPVIFLGLHLAVSVIQAYVFMLLCMIYLAQATAHDH